MFPVVYPNDSVDRRQLTSQRKKRTSVKGDKLLMGAGVRVISGAKALHFQTRVRG